MGPRARRSAVHARLRAASRALVARRDAADAGIGAIRVHRAQSAVPDGQPGRIRAGRDSRVQTGRPRLPLCRPSHRHRRRARHAWSATSRRSSAKKGAIYGEFPAYEPGHYTFLADYLPYANGDGMEHRNSTVITSSSSIAQNRSGAARHGRPRVLPQLERRADSSAVARTVQLRSGEHVGRAVARRRVYAVLRPARAQPRRASPIFRPRPRPSRAS